MDRTFHLQITTADGAVVDTQTNYAGFPLADGDYGILKGHAAMIAALREGVITFKTDAEPEYVAVSGGVLSVADDEVIVLARSAELAENIDLARAQAAESRASKILEEKSADMDMHRAQLSLYRALAREKAYYLSHNDK